MKSTTQKDALGCGIACVAMVVGKSYADAKKSFPNSTKSLLCKDLLKALKKSGIDSQYKYIGNKKIKYLENDIVFVRRCKKYLNGHYLVRKNGLWMDSWINFSKDQNIKNATSGYRKRLPEKAIYLVRVVR